MTHYYAALSPRGFQNEVGVHKFASHKTRDEWVEETSRAYVITSKEARYYLTNRGDPTTQNYNYEVDHNEPDNSDEMSTEEIVEKLNSQFRSLGT